MFSHGNSEISRFILNLDVSRFAGCVTRRAGCVLFVVLFAALFSCVPLSESPLVLTPVEVEAHACRLSCPMRISGRVVWEETYEANSGMILQKGDIVEAGTSRSWPFF